MPTPPPTGSSTRITQSRCWCTRRAVAGSEQSGRYSPSVCRRPRHWPWHWPSNPKYRPAPRWKPVSDTTLEREGPGGAVGHRHREGAAHEPAVVVAEPRGRAPARRTARAGRRGARRRPASRCGTSHPMRGAGSTSAARTREPSGRSHSTGHHSTSMRDALGHGRGCDVLGRACPPRSGRPTSGRGWRPSRVELGALAVDLDPAVRDAGVVVAHDVGVEAEAVAAAVLLAVLQRRRDHALERPLERDRLRRRSARARSGRPAAAPAPRSVIGPTAVISGVAPSSRLARTVHCSAPRDTPA